MIDCYVRNEIQKWIDKSDNDLPYLRKLSTSIKKYIEGLYPDIHTTLHGKIYMFMHNMTNTPICSVCNSKHVKSFVNMNVGFSHFCSTVCSNRSPETKHKKVLKFREHYGVDNCFQSEEVKEISKLKIRRKFGVDNVSQSQEIKNEKVKTCRKSLGTDYPFQNEDVRNTCKKKWVKKYGVDNPSKVPEFQLRKELTCYETHGVRFPGQSEEVKELSKEKCLLKYGVPFVTQVPEIISKFRKKYYYNGIYFDSSYEVLYYCWLKKQNIDFLYHNFNSNFWYEYNNTKHKYFPDFYLKNENKYIEIKGEHFFENGKMICPYNRDRDNEFQAKYEMMLTIPNLIIIKDCEFKDNGIDDSYTNYIRKLCLILEDNKIINFDLDITELTSDNFDLYVKRALELKESENDNDLLF